MSNYDLADEKKKWNERGRELHQLSVGSSKGIALDYASQLAAAFTHIEELTALLENERALAKELSEKCGRLEEDHITDARVVAAAIREVAKETESEDS